MEIKEVKQNKRKWINDWEWREKKKSVISKEIKVIGSLAGKATLVRKESSFKREVIFRRLNN